MQVSLSLSPSLSTISGICICIFKKKKSGQPQSLQDSRLKKLVAMGMLLIIFLHFPKLYSFDHQDERKGHLIYTLENEQMSPKKGPTFNRKYF